MTLQQLRYVVTIAEIGTISKAAEELFVSQPSLTKALKELEKEMQKAETELASVCEELSELRKVYGKQLEDRIIQGLQDLNFLDVKFEIDFETTEHYTANGNDKICFTISTNPGEPLRPLVKVVSGGELSRIMLAFKSALADRDALPTVIYDEIDTGVSGLAAGRIGQKLKQTASGHQVLCITHTPQIAAFADNQLLIEKKVRDNRTFTEIHPLDLDGRVQVLARRISGDKVTDLSLANARELIEKSQG